MEMGHGEPKEKDIVWAKVKGYPWWPGTIRNILNHPTPINNKFISKKKTYIIDFIGNKSHSEVAKSDVKLFKQNYEEHCKTKNPSLIKSIELANKLYREKTKNLCLDEKNENKKKSNFLNKKRKEPSNISNINNVNNVNKGDDIRNNDIKINININVTNNNQRTVNINSFKNINNGKKKKMKKKEDDDYVYEEGEESDEFNDNEDIEKSVFDKESLENELMDIKLNRRYEKLNLNIKRKKKLRKMEKSEKSEKSEQISENFYDFEKEKVLKNEELNRIIQNLLNYQIQISNNQNNKLILSELNSLQTTIKDDKYFNINILYNQLYKLLSTFTYNKSNEIVLKSTDILSNLTNKILNSIFIISEEDINQLKAIPNQSTKPNNIIEDSDNENCSELKNICDLITNLDEISEEISIKSRRTKLKKHTNDNQKKNNATNSAYDIKSEEDLNNSNSISNSNNDSSILNLNDSVTFSDNIINIISNDLRENFEKISGSFFKNIYNRNDNGLEKKIAMKRKYVCIRLFSLLKKAFPKLDKEYIKKIILFFEYKIRLEDPLLGKKYENEIDNLFYKVKNINNEKK